MEISRGFVQINKNLFLDPIFKNKNLWQVMTYLLFRAHFEDKCFVLNQKEVFVPRGSALIGRYQGGEDCKMAESTFYDCLKRLVRMGFISKTSSPRYTIVKIIDYEVLVSSAPLISRKINDNPTENRQHNNTINIDNSKYKENSIVPTSNDTNCFIACRDKFIIYTKENINPAYQFDGKEARNLKSLINKIISAAGNKVVSEDMIEKALQFLIVKAHKDPWINERWELSMINSQFNKLTINKNKETDWDYVFGNK